MENVWNEIEKSAASTGLFLKVEAEKSVNVVFLGAPKSIQTAFVDGKTLPYDESLAARGVRPSNRVRINVWTPELDGDVHIWECALGFFKNVITCLRKYGEQRFYDSVFTISRSGTGKETTYTVLFDSPLTDEQKRVRDGLELHPLVAPSEGGDASPAPAKAAPAKAAPAPVPVQHSAPPAADDPFDAPAPAHTRDEVTQLFRDVSRDVAKDVLGQLHVTKISQIPDALLDRAYALLTDDMFS